MRGLSSYSLTGDFHLLYNEFSDFEYPKIDITFNSVAAEEFTKLILPWA